MQEIKQDIEEECKQYGEVESITIPRPSEDGTLIPGVGKVFVKFGNAESAAKAKAQLEGRTFDDRTVLATFYDEIKYDKRDFA